MKGVIQLQVEIDYQNLIKEEDLETLQRFTGLGTTEAIMEYHMKTIASQLEEVVKDMPSVVYGLEGQFMPTTNPYEHAVPQVEQQPSEEGVISSVSSVEDGEVELTHGYELTEEGREPVEEAVQPAIVEKLIEDVEKVSAEKGIPQSIVVNDATANALVDYGMQVEYSSTDSRIGSFMGFDVYKDGMEESYFIEFKSYNQFSTDYYYAK